MKRLSPTMAAFCSFLAALTLMTQDAVAGGLIGDILQGAGRATGIRPIEDLGRNGDAEHKRFKDNNPVYKRMEESASEIVRTPFSLVCTANFEAVIGAVRASCSGMSSQSFSARDNAAIAEAKQRLIDLAFTSGSEISGVSVRWCQGNFNGNGITPAPNEIILNRSLLSQSPDDIALTLAHELHHVRQYRSMGSGPFKCNYSQQYIQCGGCQDQRHPMEREAYQFEADVAARMSFNSPPSQLQQTSRIATFSSLRGTGTFLDQGSRQPPPPDPPTVAQKVKRAVPKLAKSTCTLEGKIKPDEVESCIDDLEVLYADLGKWMIEDKAKSDLETAKYYRELAEKDVDAACQILAHTVKSDSWQQTRINLCKHRTRSSIAELRSIVTE